MRDHHLVRLRGVTEAMRCAAVIALAGAALLAAGCGSSGATASGTSAAATGAAAATTASTPTTSTPAASTPATSKPTSSIAGAEVVRLPKVPEAAAPTSLATAPATSESVFLTAVFHDAEAMWKREFEAAGLQYKPARLTIFHDEVHTACGTQSAAVGPFYCPADQGVYLDTRFFDALGRSVGVRLGAFARAYVVAHEVAHHVQVLLGITGRVRAADHQDPAGTNPRSVRLELQADCFAGIWKHATYQRGQLTDADFADALRAAAVVGDDFQQRNATGTISPENWTHGSSQQRQHWLTTGFRQGEPGACDTFGS
jgi:predicted metalloprotease